MLKTTLVSSDGTIINEEFSQKDLADAYLLDMIRGKMSFGQKAFAIVSENEIAKYVIIKDNNTKWMTADEFFVVIDIESQLV